MHRILLSIFICVSAVYTAPQEASSQNTYVKISPISDTLNSTRETRVENIPPIPYLDTGSEKYSERHTSKSVDDGTRNRSEEDDTINRSEEDNNRKKIDEDDNGEIIQEDDYRNRSEEESKRSNEDNIKRKIRSGVTTVNHEIETTTEGVTDRDDAIDEIIGQTDDYENRTKPPTRPRFISKLSYFQKQDIASPVITNLVERPGRRRFKSKCRCEKIWNCPKLQITVPRCPNEYFLCCF